MLLEPQVQRLTTNSPVLLVCLSGGPKQASPDRIIVIMDEAANELLARARTLLAESTGRIVMR